MNIKFLSFFFLFFAISSHVNAEVFKLLTLEDGSNNDIVMTYKTIAPVYVQYSYGTHEHTEAAMIFTIESPTKTKISYVDFNNYRQITDLFSIPLKPLPADCFYQGTAVVEFGLITFWLPKEAGMPVAVTDNLTKVHYASDPVIECYSN